AHLAFIHSKIVRYLVPDGLLHQLSQVIRTARQPFVWALKQRDSIRHREAVRYAALGQRPSLVEAEQSSSARAAQLAELDLPGFGLHNDRHITHPRAEPPRHLGQSPLPQLIELVRLHLSTGTTRI